jgi:hypothetical protein
MATGYNANIEFAEDLVRITQWDSIHGKDKMFLVSPGLNVHRLLGYDELDHHNEPEMWIPIIEKVEGGVWEMLKELSGE